MTSGEEQQNRTLFEGEGGGASREGAGVSRSKTTIIQHMDFCVLVQMMLVLTCYGAIQALSSDWQLLKKTSETLNMLNIK